MNFTAWHKNIFILALIAVLNAALGPTDWSVWIRWKWYAILGYLMANALGVVVVWYLCFIAFSQIKDTELKSYLARNRFGAYVLAFALLLTIAVLFGLVGTSGTYSGAYNESTGETSNIDQPPMPPSKRDALIETIFFFSLLPVLFGVRTALGPKPKITVQQ